MSDAEMLDSVEVLNELTTNRGELKDKSTSFIKERKPYARFDVRGILTLMRGISEKTSR